jgi:hypothetical protein
MSTLPIYALFLPLITLTIGGLVVWMIQDRSKRT